MKKPAESTAGTTATVRFGFSTLGGFAAAPPLLEQPAASTSGTAATSSAALRTRLVLMRLTPPRGQGGNGRGGRARVLPGSLVPSLSCPSLIVMGSIKQRLRPIHVFA